MAIKGSSAASTMSRAFIVWMRKLIQMLPDNNRRLLEGANRILKAISYTADATLDTIVFASRAVALAVVAQRIVWLRAWPADY